MPSRSRPTISMSITEQENIEGSVLYSRWRCALNNKLLLIIAAAILSSNEIILIGGTAAAIIVLLLISVILVIIILTVTRYVHDNNDIAI